MIRNDLLNDRNDRAPRLWAGRPGSRASVPNLASSLLLACVGLFALPGQAQTAVFDPAAGICGRTEEVRDGIVDSISGVTDCANVTDAHLAAITGTLDLSAEGITALAAGDFDGLTALTRWICGGTLCPRFPPGCSTI